MKKSLFTFLALVLILTGCSAKLEQPKKTPDVMSTPTSTVKDEDVQPIHRPTLEEIQKHYDLSSKFSSEDAELGIIEDDQLWQEMKIQLVAYKAGAAYGMVQYCSVFAVIGDNEKMIDMKPYWGAYVFDYVIADLNEDGQSEMVGFYDWGSGIIRSVPFVLLSSGDFAGLSYADQNDKGEDDPPGLYEYRNLSIEENGRSVTADAQSVLGSDDIQSVIFYVEDGAYRYRYY